MMKKAKWLLALCLCWQAAAVEQTFRFEDVGPEETHMNRMRQDLSGLTKTARKVVRSCSDAPVNHLEKMIYSFRYCFLDPYVIIAAPRARWALCDENGEDACTFRIYVAETERDVVHAALFTRNYWEASNDDEPPTDARVDGPVRYVCSAGIERHSDGTKTKYEYVDTYIQDGVAILEIKWSKTLPRLSVEKQKELFSRLVPIVRSGNRQIEARDFLAKAMEKRAEREKKEHEAFMLRTEPAYRMNRAMSYHKNYKEDFPDFKEGNKDFVAPQKMWNRPSLKWLSQFQSDLADRDESSWNGRGDYLTVKLPATKKVPAHQCLICVAHATSEHNALQFLASFASAQGFERIALKNDKKNHRINPRLVGDYDLALKPQLDATGALIPNAEESDICFIRNNTAVRVAADRRDVSVLWIARKIDEELIAAGKGEPPTWPPSKASAPASAAESK